MDGFDRIYDLHKILSQSRQPVPLNSILNSMECSRATFNRVKRHMVDFLGAPIEYDREAGGYRYAAEPNVQYELPGTWFSQDEIFALVLMQSLLSQSGSGMLSQQLEPIRARFDQLLARSSISRDDLTRKIRMLNTTHRPVQHDFFNTIAQALLKETCLFIEYTARSNQQVSQRIISPQRLIYYRGNWYLDAWCHQKADLRTFALECIRDAKDVQAEFKTFTDAALDQHFMPSYGIFSGPANAHAKLLFSREIAHRVKDEQWHQDQHLQLQQDGQALLTIPFNESVPQELVRDILSYGAQVKVLEPTSLQERVKEQLRKALEFY